MAQTLSKIVDFTFIITEFNIKFAFDFSIIDMLSVCSDIRCSSYWVKAEDPVQGHVAGKYSTMSGG